MVASLGAYQGFCKEGTDVSLSSASAGVDPPALLLQVRSCSVATFDKEKGGRKRGKERAKSTFVMIFLAMDVLFCISLWPSPSPFFSCK